MHHHSVISRPGHRSRHRESNGDVLRGGDSGDEPGARGGCRLVGGIQPASEPGQCGGGPGPVVRKLLARIFRYVKSRKNYFPCFR